MGRHYLISYTRKHQGKLDKNKNNVHEDNGGIFKIYRRMMIMFIIFID